MTYYNRKHLHSQEQRAQSEYCPFPCRHGHIWKSSLPREVQQHEVALAFTDCLQYDSAAEDTTLKSIGFMLLMMDRIYLTCSNVQVA